MPRGTDCLCRPSGSPRPVPTKASREQPPRLPGTGFRLLAQRVIGHVPTFPLFPLFGELSHIGTTVARRANVACSQYQCPRYPVPMRRKWQEQKAIIRRQREDDLRADGKSVLTEKLPFHESRRFAPFVLAICRVGCGGQSANSRPGLCARTGRLDLYGSRHGIAGTAAIQPGRMGV